METMITQEIKPLDFLSDEQRANAEKIENKYKESLEKKPKGNMIPRKLPVIATEVKIVQEILTKLGDYSTLSDEDDIPSNIFNLSEILVDVGDLKRFPNEIAEIFVKCFSQLSVQVPIFATLLFLLFEKEPEFVSLVVQKIQTAYIQSLATDQVLTSKLLLRTIACLASAGSFSTDGSGGLLEILETLLVIVNSSSNDFEQFFPEEAIVGSYLLASTIPWALEAFLRSNDPAGRDFLQRLYDLLLKLKTAWKSPFNLSQKQSILSKTLPDLHAEVAGGDSGLRGGDDEDDEKAIPLTINGGVSDSYQEILQAAIHFLQLSLLSSSNSLEFPEIYFMPWKTLKQNQSVPEEYLQYLSNPSSSLLIFNASTFAEQMSSIFDQGLVGATFKKNYVAPSSANPRFLAASFLSYQIGEKFLANKNSNFLHGRLSIFTSDTNEEIYPCCHLSLVEKSLLFSYIEDILNYFDIVINEDGTSLGSINLLMNHLLAVGKLFSINNDPKATVGKIPIEYFLVESFFHKLISLPVNKQSNHLIIYRLILQFCKHHPTFPPIIALATNLLFFLLPSLDIFVIQQLAHWFTFHYINTSLKWPFWEVWIGECGLLKENNEAEGDEGKIEVPEENKPNNLTQLYFIRTIVQKASFAVSDEKLTLVIPEEFHQFLEGNHSTLLLNYLKAPSTDNTEGNIETIIAHFRSLIKERKKSTELIDFIETIPLFVQEENRRTLIESFIEIVISTTHESETLTSLLGILDLYHDAIQVIVEADQHHLILARKIFSICSKHRELLLIVLEEMIRRNQLSPVAVAQIILEDRTLFLQAAISDPSFLRLTNMIYDRTIDFVRASLLQRDSYGGSLPILDENADLNPVDFEAALEAIQQRLKANQSEGENGGEEINEDGGKTGGRKRNHGGEDDDRMNDDDDLANELRREEQLLLADEAVKRSVRLARLIYGLFVEAFITSLSIDFSSSSPWEAERARHVLVSSLSHIWRSFFGFQTQISSQFQQNVLITIPLANPLVLSLQQQVPELVQAWSSYLGK